MKPSTAALAALMMLLPSFAPAQPPPPRVEHVQFAAGTSSATIKGQLTGRSDVDYLVRAGAGQTMTVSLDSTSTANAFNLLPPGSTDVAMFVGDGVLTVTRVLPSDGEYRIRVYLGRAAARRQESGAYTLHVSITGATLKPLSGAADALVAGTPFHATGLIPCSPPFGLGTAPCEAGVIRRGRDGTATVDVHPAQGTPRRILFVKGVPVASDAPGGLTFTKQDDLTIVSIAPDERYEIREAFLIGG